MQYIIGLGIFLAGLSLGYWLAIQVVMTRLQWLSETVNNSLFFMNKLVQEYTAELAIKHNGIEETP